MRYLVILVFSLSMAAFSESSPHNLRHKEAYFKKLSMDDFVATQDMMAEQSVRSVKDCGRKCMESEGCVMFTYQPNQQDRLGHCRVYGQLPNSTMENSPGARSYTLYGADLCNNGYSLICGRCLSFVMIRMAYGQAADHCRQLDQGHLIMTKTLYDLQCAICVMKINGITDGWVWVGADDKQTEGRFVWSDGTALFSNSSLWDGNQPDGTTASEDCVSMLLRNQRLHDSMCGSLKRYTICEKTIP